MNVVIVAHTKYDESTGRFIIPASGAFKDGGSWTSVVNDSIYIEQKNGKLVVHLDNLKYPCRTTLTDLPEYMLIEEYNLQEHLDKLTASKLEALEFEY